MLKSLLIVCAGSFIGGAMRFLLSTFMKNICAHGFPWGTLAVNLLGCFLFGIIFAIFSRNSSVDNAMLRFQAQSLSSLSAHLLLFIHLILQGSEVSWVLVSE